MKKITQNSKFKLSMINYKGNPIACNQFSVTIEAQKEISIKIKIRSNPLENKFQILTCNEKRV
jgi:hypothetical protein